jgi:hypothetical protein
MIKTLFDECNHFLEHSNGIPLIKTLPKIGEGFRRVKVRHRKTLSKVGKSFDAVIESEYKNFINRCVTAYNHYPDITNPLMEHFFIFPVDGYKVIYNPSISNSTTQLEKIYSLLESSMGAESSMQTLSDMVAMSYTPYKFEKNHNPCEFLIYDISHFYAIRTSIVDNEYQKFFDENMSLNINDFSDVSYSKINTKLKR